ncbi:MAG TPA: NAD(P)-dependent alcohol dehydrogenase, partial [Thermoanaerobaculia bacterium]|nr:NAD(P)-dependent alcohol dehydrogenase [Thermoanaerobaculia bacterium]
RYGAPDVLELVELEKPAPGADEVLVRVRAASVNAYDLHFMRGEPFLVRAMFGLHRPREPRVGVDVSGEVESVGANVRDLKPGDAVFGTARGAFGEYVCASKVVRKPSGVTFEEAAALPVAGFTALQAIRDKGRVQPGEHVLVHGAAGGVGTFAVQIAKAYGAEVTAVSRTENLDLLRSIGADHVIDYTRDDFTKSGRYHVIVDCHATHPLAACRRALAPNGRYVMVGSPSLLAPIAALIAAKLLSIGSSRKAGIVSAKNNLKDLATLAELMKAGKLKPVIDRSYTLSEVPEAILSLEAGRARGKIVIHCAGATARDRAVCESPRGASPAGP